MKGLRRDNIEIKKLQILEVFTRNLVILTVVTALAFVFGFSAVAHSTQVDPTDPTLDGAADLPGIIPDPGDYNGILGGKFPPPGNAINGDIGSGGTFSALDDGFGFFPPFAWGKDDFFSNQQGVAFTLGNNGIAVWDNNGIEDGSYATINKVCIGGVDIGDACNVDGDCTGSTCSSTSFYEEAFGELLQPGCCTTPRSDNGQVGVGRNHAFGMSNFIDFIYASRVELLAPTTIDEIIAYLTVTGRRPFRSTPMTHDSFTGSTSGPPLW